MLKRLEAHISTSHAVAQFVFIPKERHEAHVGLDVDRLVKDQYAIGFPRNWLHGMDFLRHILQLPSKLLNLWAREQENHKCITSTNCSYQSLIFNNNTPKKPVYGSSL